MSCPWGHPMGASLVMQVEPAVSWLMDHSEDADIDEPLPGPGAPSRLRSVLKYCVVFTCGASMSPREAGSLAGPAVAGEHSAALGTETRTGEGTVMGIPSMSRTMSITPDVINPDGATVPAMLVGVGCECKVMCVNEGRAITWGLQEIGVHHDAVLMVAAQ